MPSHIGIMPGEIPIWFSKSTLRSESYRKVFEIIIESTEAASMPHPFQKHRKLVGLLEGKFCIIFWLTGTN